MSAFSRNEVRTALLPGPPGGPQGRTPPRRYRRNVMTLLTFVVALVFGGQGHAADVLATAPSVTPPVATPDVAGALRRVRLDTMRRTATGYVAELVGGAHADLKLDPRLQDAAEGVFDEFHIPYGAAVVVSIPDGRVLALAGKSSVAPELGP